MSEAVEKKTQEQIDAKVTAAYLIQQHNYLGIRQALKCLKFSRQEVVATLRTRRLLLQETPT